MKDRKMDAYQNASNLLIIQSTKMLKTTTKRLQMNPENMSQTNSIDPERRMRCSSRDGCDTMFFAQSGMLYHSGRLGSRMSSFLIHAGEKVIIASMRYVPSHESMGRVYTAKNQASGKLEARKDISPIISKRLAIKPTGKIIPYSMMNIFSCFFRDSQSISMIRSECQRRSMRESCELLRMIPANTVVTTRMRRM